MAKTPVSILLDRLEQLREELSRAWLLRVMERASLTQMAEMRSDRLAFELPQLISDVLELARRLPESAPPERGFGEEKAVAVRIQALLGGQGRPASELAADISSLELLILGALRLELPESDMETWAGAVERLATVFGLMQAAAAEEAMRVRMRELEWMAQRDPLTGLFNVGHFHEQLATLLGTQERYGHPFSLLLIDIDGMKRINDTHGHAAGNRILVAVAATIRDEIRTVDLAFRYGGDEFCVLAPNTTAADAKILADRLAAVVDSSRPWEGSAVQISTGVGACPEHAATAERLMEIADRAMYRSKQSGQRVTIGDPTALGS